MVFLDWVLSLEVVGGGGGFFLTFLSLIGCRDRCHFHYYSPTTWMQRVTFGQSVVLVLTVTVDTTNN